MRAQRFANTHVFARHSQRHRHLTFFLRARRIAAKSETLRAVEAASFMKKVYLSDENARNFTIVAAASAVWTARRQSIEIRRTVKRLCRLSQWAVLTNQLRI